MNDIISFFISDISSAVGKSSLLFADESFLKTIH